MIPYGLYVLTGEADGGAAAAATVNWVTQVSFVPPLVVVGVKADSSAHAVIKEARRFALNVLGKSQGDVAYKFFKPAQRDGETIAGERVTRGGNGAPLLASAAAALECTLIDTVERGDHSVFVGEVTGARVAQVPAGRPDDAVLLLRDLGEKVFYGG
ncbi:MAG: flavin reductase family protein [Candidatus Binatia bacterium]